MSTSSARRVLDAGPARIENFVEGQALVVLLPSSGAALTTSTRSARSWLGGWYPDVKQAVARILIEFVKQVFAHK